MGELKNVMNAAVEQHSSVDQEIHDDVCESLRIVERESFQNAEGVEVIATLARQLREALERYSALSSLSSGSSSSS